MQFTIKNLAFPGWKYGLWALIVVAVGGYLFFGRNGNMGATLVIVPGDFREEVSVSGTVIAARDADLGFAANGRIAGVYARVGQHVAAGTILAQTENGDLVAALLEAQADLASLRAGTRPEEIAVASTAVANAQAELVDSIQSAYTTSDDAIHNKVDTFFTNARTDPKLTFTTSNASLKATIELGRASIEPILTKWAALVRNLSRENAASGAAESQTHLAQVTTLLADINAAINQGVPDPTVTSVTLSSYGTTLATARSNVNGATATLTSDSAALDSAEKNLALKQAGSTPETIAAQEAAAAAAAASLAKTRIFAPFGGMVTRMDAKVGEITSPTVSLISLQSDGVFQIETFIPEIVIARVAVGDPATTTLDAYGSSALFPATVVAVDPAETVKDGVPTYKTTLSFLAADPRIRSGMTVNVVIETGVLEEVIVIPGGAVGTKNGSSYVSALDSSSVVSRTVTVGRSPALGQIEILSGLSSGDTILLTPEP
ncbi:efflux RND transporter periplasmic adaptor subunit [Candidatus Kaiserbacteria bacterium]|nr:efflux RND transporter periplasmic adaptor subunit [Candidatus Kaiserbacteria bacterium]